jgi:perosamine synthetase
MSIPLRPEATAPARFVPAFPTIRPGALFRFGGEGVRSAYPFNEPTARSFYFARNAIWRAVQILGLDRGEILVPAYHHGVEIEALIDAGARVRFYRIGAHCEVDLKDVASKIGPDTRALYLTHFLGFPGPVRAMRELADRHGLPLIEDCALSLFSSDRDLPLGVTGDVAVFCLYKVLAVPDGGVLLFNGAARQSAAAFLAEATLPPPPVASNLAVAASSILRNVALRGGAAGRALRQLGLRLGKGALRASKVEPVLSGTQHFNRDHAHLGPSLLTQRLLKVQDIEEIVARRRRNYMFLLDRLGDVSLPLFADLPRGVVPLCYPMRVDDNRRVMERLVSRGIEAVDFWREGHPLCDLEEFPEVAQLRRSVLEIPCHQDLSFEAVTDMVAVIREVVA